MAFKEWIDMFDNTLKTVKKQTAKKTNPYFRNRLLSALNNALTKEGYQFILINGNKLIPNDINKAINSEMGETTAPGQSTTKEPPSEIVRTFVVKARSNKAFIQHFDLKLKLDRPHQIFEIQIINKDKEK